MFRHSGARNGCVSLKEVDGRIIVTVRDDGKGIEEQVIQLRPDSVGVGIGGMRQRVNELGGRLTPGECQSRDHRRGRYPARGGTSR